MGALSPIVAEKLTKICGRLGSDFEGERAAAALLATRLLRDAGLTWEDAIQAAPVVREQPRQGSGGYGLRAPHADKVEYALRNATRLNDWERKFLGDIGRRWRLTPKQADSLNRILFKLQNGGAV